MVPYGLDLGWRGGSKGPFPCILHLIYVPYMFLINQRFVMVESSEKVEQLTIKVAPEDRQAAEDFFTALGQTTVFANGCMDHHALVQALARHRVGAYEKGRLAGYESGVADGVRLAGDDLVPIRQVTLDELARMVVTRDGG